MLYSVWENLAAENHEDVKHNSIFVAGYYNRKNDIFPFADILSLISFLKKSLGIKILLNDLVKLLLIASR